MADAVELAIGLTDKVSGPARKVTSSLKGIEETLERIRSADRMATAVMKNKASLMAEQIRAQNKLQIASMRAERAGGGMFESILGGIGLGAGAGLVGILGLIATKAIDAGLALARMAANAALAFGQAVAGASLFREKTLLAFNMLGKGAFKSEAQLERIKTLALDLGVPFEETASQFQKLLAMQFSARAAEDIIKMGADLRALGADSEQVQRAIQAITQIKAKGRLQSEELVGQLAESGVSTELVMKALGKQLGKTTEEVRKLLEAGKITADQGIAAVGEAIKEKAGIRQFGDAGKKFANETLAGMMGRLQNMKGFLLDELAKRVLPALKQFGPILDDIFKGLQSPEAQKVLDAIGAVIVGIANAVRAAWPTIKAFISGLGEGFSKGWDSAMKSFEAFNKAFGDETNMQDMTALANAAGKAFGLMAASVAATAVALTNLGKAWDTAFGTLDLSKLPLGGPQTSSSGLMGNLGLAGFGGGGPAASNSLSVNVSGVGKNDQELATIIRREAERIFLSKFGGASPS